MLRSIDSRDQSERSWSRLAMLLNGGVKQSGKARISVETEDERYERLRTTRERMAISRRQDIFSSTI